MSVYRFQGFRLIDHKSSMQTFAVTPSTEHANKYGQVDISTFAECFIKTD